MKNRKHRRRMRITHQGYVVLCALLLFVMIIVCVCLLSCQSKSEAEGADATAAAEASTTPEIDFTPVPTEAPTPVPSPTPGLSSSGVRLPTAQEEEAAVDGILRTSGVVLRAGPGQTFDILQKYEDGERVLIYTQESAYYLVKVLSDGTYGYMSAEFIIKFGLLPDEAMASPVPVVPAGAIMGIVNVNEVSLRSVASKKNNTPIGSCTRSMLLWVQFEENGFYYAEVASTGEKGFLYSKYIMTQADVPAGSLN